MIEERIIIGVNIELGEPNELDTSKIEKCPECNKEMWITRRTQQLRETHKDWRVCCLACLKKEVEKELVMLEVRDIPEMN